MTDETGTDGTGTLPPSPPDVGEPQSPVDPVPVTQPPPAVARSRAGRNLPAAIGVALALVALILLTLYVERTAFVVLATVAVGVAVWELANALATAGIDIPRVPVLVAGSVLLVAAYAGGADGLVAAMALGVLLLLLWTMGQGVEQVAASVLTLAYVPFLAGFAMLLVRPEDGANRIVLFILVTVCSDVGGYAAGVFLGRHPMAPTVSPKKSWEGFAGSAVACLCGGALAGPWLVGITWEQGLVLGVAIVSCATLGDLGESLLKRDLGIKDMGSLLPGHGGLMDRLDSLLPSAAATYLVLVASGGPL